MPATLTPVEQQELSDALEAAWCAWISTLKPWERTFVLANELEFHDLFASGEWGWADLAETLRERFAA